MAPSVFTPIAFTPTSLAPGATPLPEPLPNRQAAIDAMAAFERDILNNESNQFSDPMPAGKADFPPLGVGIDDEPPATVNLR